MLANNTAPSMDKKTDEPQEWLLRVYLNEYVKLKDEQMQRLHFRDNLLYVTLVVFGGIMSYAMTDPSHYYAFLVLPWVCLILGWTYLVNDEKNSAIGRYIRLTLTDKLGEMVKVKPETASLLGWETAHRSDKARGFRKIFQLIIDETTFFLSGLVAIGFFWFLVPSQPFWGLQLLLIVELVLLCSLGLWIFVYADLKKGR